MLLCFHRACPHKREILTKSIIHKKEKVLQKREAQLPKLRPRPKGLVPGDIVLIADATAPRGSWLLGRVLETYADKKGLVRSARVKTKTSTLDRPITKLCLIQEADT